MNSQDTRMTGLCNRVKESSNQHIKQLFIENNSTIQQILLLPFSDFFK